MEFHESLLNFGESPVELNIWDAGGGPYYVQISLIPTKNVIPLFCFDISKKETFESLKSFWIPKHYEKATSTSGNFLIGLKQDLRKDREVSVLEAEEYASQINAVYFECSAKEEVGMGPLSIINSIVRLYES
mmetsp:Transcript_4535/g.3751  ORF Transcript_4535/g.3751 Transcript_4535/m.3751 type:complete len:132 (+) Transcript_4535:407-802(+)